MMNGRGRRVRARTWAAATLALAVAALGLGAAEHGLAQPAPQTVPGDLGGLRPKPGLPMSDADVFATLDANGDGTVASGEWRERKMVIFYLLDRDGDFVLVAAEVPGLAPAEFAAIDTDKDGRLSGYEFNQASIMRFEAADTDGDRAVTPAELQAFRRRLAGG